MPDWPKCSTPRARVRWPCTEPSQPSVGRMAVDDGDQRAMRRQIGKQPLDMAVAHAPGRARARARGGPAGIQPVGRGDGEQADVAAVFRHQADGLDCLGRDGARDRR